jgi:hypothetical protein
MDEMLAGAGILCILAAIMTRQLKARDGILAVTSSTRRQALLRRWAPVGASFLC